MPQNGKPAAASGGHQEIQITDWRSHNKNTLKAFFTATLPSGLILHGLMLHEQNDSRWIGYPARGWTDPAGEKRYVRFVEFHDRATSDKFRDAVLAAIDRYLGGAA